MKKVIVQVGEKELEFTSEQKEFCELYVSKEFFANGTQSYIEAYGIDVTQPGAYNGARASASRLLTDASILAYIECLLDLSGLNDQFVDKQMTFLITQNADFGSKLGAIKEYNKLKQRIIEKTENEHNHNFQGFGFLPGDEPAKS